MPAGHLTLQATWLKTDIVSDDVVIHDVSGLEDAIDEDLIAGRNVEIFISITLHETETVSGSDVSIIDTFINEQPDMNNTRIVYLDISLFLIEEGDDPEQVRSTLQPIVITIEIPEEQRGFVNYVILRMRDGVVDMLETIHDEENHTLTFTTDRFSTYTIVYEVPGAGFSLWWLTPVALIPIGIVGFLYKNRITSVAKRMFRQKKAEA